MRGIYIYIFMKKYVSPICLLEKGGVNRFILVSPELRTFIMEGVCCEAPLSLLAS